MNKQMVLALGAGVTAFAAVVGSAATLGGLNSDNLGADTTVVAACDTGGIDVTYTSAYDAAAVGYVVSGLALANVDAACNGQSLNLTIAGALTDHDSDPLTADVRQSVHEETVGVLAVAAGAATVPLTTDVLAEDVEYLAVVISG